MAEPKEQNYGGLAGAMDMTKINPYGVDDERLTELRDAQQKSIDALQNRYDKPNWFKVAAGFAKPQLGGFLASLGSASEALGENVEQQRAQQLPISQMKIQMAQQNMLLSNKQKAAAIVAKAQREGRPLTRSENIEISNYDPERGKMLGEGQALELQKTTSQQAGQRLTLDAIQAKQRAGVELSPGELNYLTQLSKNQDEILTTSQGKPPAIGMSNETTNPTTVPKENGNRHTVNGIVMSDDVYNLYKDGIPIISNFRTQEQQDAIPRDPNNPNLTAQGHTVAKIVGAHGTGDGIDVGPLTKDQKQKLINNDWVQSTDPNDLNHWEKRGSKTSAKTGEPTAAPQTETSKTENGFYPMTFQNRSIVGEPTLRQELIQNQDAETVKSYEEPLKAEYARNSIIYGGSNPTFTQLKSNLNSAIKMIQDDPAESQSVLNIIRDKGPIVAALNQGIRLEAGQSGVSVFANLRLPIDASLRAVLPPESQNYQDSLFGKFAQIAYLDLKKDGLSDKEITGDKLAERLQLVANPDLTPLGVWEKLNKNFVNLEHAKNYHDIVTNELSTKVNPKSATKFSDVRNHSKALALEAIKTEEKLAAIDREVKRQRDIAKEARIKQAKEKQ
jgi:hypothetical protein